MIKHTSVADIHAPAFLEHKKIWLVWRSENNGSSKPRKIPYYTNGIRRNGVQGSPEDLAGLATFAEAKRVAENNDFTGLGIAMVPGNGFSVVDFDACVTDGTIHPDLARLWRDNYTEYSPSGTGLHVFISNIMDDRKSTAKDGKWGIELFSNKGFITFTGNTLEGSVPELRECGLHLVTMIYSRFKPIEYIPQYYPKPDEFEHQKILHYLSFLPADLGYDDWVRVGMAIHHNSGGTEDGFTIWNEWSSQSDKYTSEGDLRTHWSSFGNNPSVAVTIGSLIRMANMYGADEPEPVEFSAIENQSEIAEEYKPTFKFVSAEEFCSTAKKSEWLIDGFLPRATIGVLYGDAGSGKSFLALDMCASLVRGIKWNGLRCKKASRVLYVVAEGASGFASRIKAYKEHHKIESIEGMDIVQSPILNLTQQGNYKHFINDLARSEPYDVIVVDTLAQVTPGINENSAEDFTRVIDLCNKINHASCAMVLLVHHTGKDTGKGARGHSSLRGAADAMFEISREGDYRSIKVTKQKDGEETGVKGFKLRSVHLGFEELSDLDIGEGVETGKEITSCVIEYCDAPLKDEALGENQKAILEVFTQNGNMWVNKKDLVTRAILNLEEVEDDKKENQRGNVRRAIDKGVGKFLVVHENGGEYKAIHVNG